jgi:CheY-like chemotaxis protein
MAYILVVDDDEDFVDVVTTVLKSDGHEVDSKLDIQAAVDSMAERKPDLVVLDVMFPEDSTAGFTLARTMRLYNDQLKDTPILMLTAINTKFPLGFNENDIDGHWLPVSDFVEKPVDLDVLKKKVQSILKAEPAGSGNGGEK